MARLGLAELVMVVVVAAALAVLREMERQTVFLVQALLMLEAVVAHLFQELVELLELVVAGLGLVGQLRQPMELPIRAAAAVRVKTQTEILQAVPAAPALLSLS